MRTEEDLLKQAQNFDPAALRALHHRLYEPTYRYIYLKVGDGQISEDLTGEVFIRLLEGLKKGNGWQTTPEAWLFGITRNVVVDHYRRQGRQSEVALDEDLTADPELSPVKGVEAAEERRELAQAIDSLPDEYRDIILLRYLEGLSINHVAEKLNKTTGAIKGLQYRALQALAKTMQPYPSATRKTSWLLAWPLLFGFSGQKTLNQALQSLQAGEGVEVILSRFRPQAGWLEPLLRLAQDLYTLGQTIPSPSPAASLQQWLREASLQRFLTEAERVASTYAPALISSARPPSGGEHPASWIQNMVHHGSLGLSKVGELVSAVPPAVVKTAGVVLVGASLALTLQAAGQINLSGGSVSTASPVETAGRPPQPASTPSATRKPTQPVVSAPAVNFEAALSPTPPAATSTRQLTSDDATGPDEADTPHHLNQADEAVAGDDDQSEAAPFAHNLDDPAHFGDEVDSAGEENSDSESSNSVDDDSGSGSDSSNSGSDSSGSESDNSSSGSDNSGSGSDSSNSGSDSSGSESDNSGSGSDSSDSTDDSSNSGSDDSDSTSDTSNSGSDDSGSVDDSSNSGSDDSGSADDSSGSGSDDSGSVYDSSNSGSDDSDPVDDSSNSGSDDSSGSADDSSNSGSYDSSGSGSDDSSNSGSDDSSGSGSDDSGSVDDSSGSGSDDSGSVDDSSDSTDDSSGSGSDKSGSESDNSGSGGNDHD
jgi:RNA polymerase sigma factor (sigma-70 family)